MTSVGEVAPARPTAHHRARWPWLVVLAAAGLVVAAVLGTGLGRDPTVVDSVLLGRPAPPLAGSTLDGDSFDLDDYRGKVVLVNVWASWCAPCRREYPLLEQAVSGLTPLGLQVVGINTQDTVEDARAFLKDMGGENFPSVVDPGGRLAVEWGTFGVPETFVVGRDGQLRAKYVGELSGDWITTTVLPLLEQR